MIMFIEDLNKMQSTEFTCPRRRNEFWQTASTPSLRTSLLWKNASWKLSTIVETRIIRKTTYASKGPEVTLRHIWERTRTPTLCAILAKPRSNLQMWDFDSIPSESRNWSNEELPQGQHSEWEGREENSWSRQLRVAYDKFLSNSLQRLTW